MATNTGISVPLVSLPFPQSCKPAVDYWMQEEKNWNNGHRKVECAACVVVKCCKGAAAACDFASSPAGAPAALPPPPPWPPPLGSPLPSPSPSRPACSELTWHFTQVRDRAGSAQAQ